ncbi:MIX and LysM peptidoglycan-binding domain-containing protein [Vibrio rhizosphaerae]|uniref:MIX and LysM peptidoglycan-binding domain-containing protein n=1 Tax=Vibrio rhizosphaerae TaxID=398736 RepID=UPI00068E516D|nr:LysM peptidoglycan-binding domain-containing protein [Vibrio rhizosphaerae]
MIQSKINADILAESNHSQSSFSTSSYSAAPTLPERPDEIPNVRFEYHLEIACSDESRRAMIRYGFALKGQEVELTTSPQNQYSTEYGTRYTYYTAYNDPKRIMAFNDLSPLGISVPHPIQVKPIGSGFVREAFIPVQPAIQVGDHLGLPTEGYIYHFHQARLVQEYHLMPGGSGSFYATLSRHEKLNQARGCPCAHDALLVFWKIGCRDVHNQHLLYLKKPITRAQLDALNETWLDKHAVRLDLQALLDITREPVVLRSLEQPTRNEQKNADDTLHTVQRIPGTNLRESWLEIAVRYGLSAKALLDLNPQYHADPMALKIGDVLTIESQKRDSHQENLIGQPPKVPQTYNHPLNSYYAHQDTYLAGTTIKAMNSRDLVRKDIPVVRLNRLV